MSLEHLDHIKHHQFSQYSSHCMHWQLFLQCHESINNNTSHLKEKPIYHINMQTLKNTYVDISGRGGGQLRIHV